MFTTTRTHSSLSERDNFAVGAIFKKQGTFRHTAPRDVSIYCATSGTTPRFEGTRRIIRNGNESVIALTISVPDLTRNKYGALNFSEWKTARGTSFIRDLRSSTKLVRLKNCRTYFLSLTFKSVCSVHDRFGKNTNYVGTGNLENFPATGERFLE